MEWIWIDNGDDDHDDMIFLQYCCISHMVPQNLSIWPLAQQQEHTEGKRIIT